MDYSFMNIITDKVANVLEPQGYVRRNVDNSGKDYAALFTGEINAYMVVYNAKKKLTTLKVCGMNEDGPDNQWKSMNTWIFDPETDGNKEASSIGNDFADALSVRKPKISGKSRKKNGDDGTADPKFFCKRMVNVFPELKEEIWEEEDSYDPFRGVTFAEGHIVPKVNELLKSGNRQQTDKLASVLNAQYSAGDLSTRSIITIVVLNGIKPEYDSKIEALLDDDLKKAWKYAKAYRKKKVKPEKVKKIDESLAEKLGQ